MSELLLEPIFHSKVRVFIFSILSGIIVTRLIYSI